MDFLSAISLLGALAHTKPTRWMLGRWPLKRLQGALHGFQIGRAAQFGFLIQTHEVRQTHERGMHIVSRSGIIGAHHAGQAGLLGEQSFELRLALEVHFLGVAQHLGKAHKHQCIAKTLFAMEQ